MENKGSDVESDEELGDLFPEPEGYYKPPPPSTTVAIPRVNGSNSPSTISLRLVGQHSLWAHHLWNAGRVLANYLDAHPSLVRGKTILELGAGGALPSFIAACNSAAKVVITDYPDTELIENIKFNVINCGINQEIQSRIAIEGYLWGSEAEPLQAHINGERFDVMILSDTVFNHSEHNSLVKSLQLNLKKTLEARVYVFYTHHRPWLKEKDLEFFEVAKEAGFVMEEILVEHVQPMFKEDRGDEKERGTVYGRLLKWAE